jgi:hypothetical protein
VTPFLTILSGCLLGLVIAALVVSCLCSLSILRNEKPHWSYAPFSIVVGLFGSLALIFRGEVLHPAGWPDKIPGQWNFFVVALVEFLFFSLVIVLIAVDLFQQRYRKHLSVSERKSAWRQRRSGAQRRNRWLFLLVSGTLIVGFSTCLVLVFSADSSADIDKLVVADYPTKTPAQGKPTHGRFDNMRFPENGAVLLWPFCLVGLLASGGWFAYTITYWRGKADWRVKWR